MKKRSMILLLALGLTLSGCVGQEDSGNGAGLAAGGEEDGTGTSTENPGEGTGSGTAAENEPESENPDQEDESSQEVSGRNDENRQFITTEGMKAVQGGPYGEISVTLPAGWKYELCPMDSEVLMSTKYGIHFSPEGAEQGYIEVGYAGFFGVCGTGLENDNSVIAGVPANMGTYDNHAYWDFIAFKEEMDGVVALTYRVEDWWEEYGDAVTEILDTMTFAPDVKEGGACVFKEESENREIGLYFSLKEISSAGATLVYNQFDPEAPSGRLQDGDDFILEQQIDGQWVEVPVVVEGDYGFNGIAYMIPNEEITERNLSWEWLYGQLAPGEYRLGKSVLDFRETGDYDKYKIYAYFMLN